MYVRSLPSSLFNRYNKFPETQFIEVLYPAVCLHGLPDCLVTDKGKVSSPHLLHVSCTSCMCSLPSKESIMDGSVPHISRTLPHLPNTHVFSPLQGVDHEWIFCLRLSRQLLRRADCTRHRPRDPGSVSRGIFGCWTNAGRKGLAYVPINLLIYV